MHYSIHQGDFMEFKEFEKKMAWGWITLVGVILVGMATSIGGLYLRMFNQPTRLEVKELINENNAVVNNNLNKQEKMIEFKLDVIKQTNLATQDHIKELDTEIRHMSSEMSRFIEFSKKKRDSRDWHGNP